jgi:hypothetical protein
MRVICCEAILTLLVLWSLQGTETHCSGNPLIETLLSAIGGNRSTKLFGNFVCLNGQDAVSDCIGPLVNDEPNTSARLVPRYLTVIAATSLTGISSLHFHHRAVRLQIIVATTKAWGCWVECGARAWLGQMF